MTSEIVSVLCGGPGLVIPNPIWFQNNFDNLNNQISPCAAYQKLLDSSESDVIIYVHDDVTIHDSDWHEHVMQCFTDRPECVTVGLGGALGLGNRDLYRKPYDIWNLARRSYMSNQTDWGTHGALLTETRRVAVLDAFFLAVRSDFIRALGGWPVARLTHHCLDLWLACEAARAAKETWAVAVSCTHHGGGSSTTRSYTDAGWLQGGTLALDHQIPHRWIWDSYRDVLPLETP